MSEPVKAVSSAFEGLLEGCSRADPFSWPALFATRHVAMNICCHPIQCCDDGTLPAAAIEPRSCLQVVSLVILADYTPHSGR
jgi:hypothetical protein